jgi:threonine dehydrogenase-like Zn-dependent dehydrogenase
LSLAPLAVRAPELRKGSEMKAAVLTGIGEVVMVEDWPEPVPAPGEVVVELAGVGVCGSDIAVWSGERRADLPWILGHEGAGTIVAAGAGVSGARIGERVVIEPNYPCGECPGCRRGRTSLCSGRLSVGMNVPGLLRERAAVPAQYAWTAPDGLTDQDLVCVEPMAVVRHAARVGNAAAGTRCLIVGAGSQGLLLLLALRAIGAEVSVVEPHAGRLEIATSLGARQAESPAYELVFETSGSVAGTQQALRSLDVGGTLVLIGLPHGDVPLSTASIVRRHGTVLGSIIYDHPGDFRQTLAFVADNALSLSSIVRRTFGFSDSQAALRCAATVPGKSWIKF